MSSRHRHPRLLLLLVAALVAAGLSGCLGSDKRDDSGKAYTGSPGKQVPVKFNDVNGGTVLTTKRSKLGVIVAGQNERTLYSYKTGDGQPPDCSGQCAWTWLPVPVGIGVKVSGKIDKSKVGAVRYSDRVDQITYGGHPLYYFAGDKGIEGNGMKSYGATWFAIDPAGMPAGK